jgi:hypothetical protein
MASYKQKWSSKYSLQVFLFSLFFIGIQELHAENCVGGTIENTSNSSTTSLKDNANGQCIINSGTLEAANGIHGDNAIESFHRNTTITNNGLITLNRNESMALFITGPDLYGVSDPNIFFTNNSSIVGSGNNAFGVWIYYNVGSAGSILNTGEIRLSGGGSIGIYNYSDSTIETLTNTGVIYAAETAIANSGAITTLNNAQGGNSSSPSTTALNYLGNLPTNYNIIINSPTHYGQLSLLDPNLSGPTSFGIYNSSVITSRLYTAVLQGIEDSNVSGTRTGTYDNMNWTLALQPESSTTWDLTFSGASLTQTQSSLASHARKLSGTMNILSLISQYPNSATYDCNLFDVKGMCISAGGRYSTVDNPSSNSSAAVVTLGYKVSPNIRIGGFLDQSVTNNNPTGIDISNKNPMMGAFAYWNQQADGLGYQVKLANAYQDKDLTTTRDVIGTSEAGRGTTSLNSRSYVGELSYAFMYKENTLVRPYFALRHTSIEQDAYTETGVTTPLTYSALNNRTTSALMGVKFKHALTPKANLIGSLGVEQDLHNKTDRLTATGIAGLTSENLSSDLHRTRPVASIGATYDIAKTQRLTGEVLVQQLPFQNTAGATAYFNYMIGF